MFAGWYWFTRFDQPENGGIQISLQGSLQGFRPAITTPHHTPHTTPHTSHLPSPPSRAREEPKLESSTILTRRIQSRQRVYFYFLFLFYFLGPNLQLSVDCRHHPPFDLQPSRYHKIRDCRSPTCDDPGCTTCPRTEAQKGWRREQKQNNIGRE